MHFYLFLDRMEKVMNTFDRFYKKTVIPILFIYVLSYIVCYNVIAYDTSIENGIYIISDANDLQSFAEYVSDGNAGSNAKLIDDIDLSDICSQTTEGWIPIGSESEPYTGTFDGQGYSISGLYINCSLNYCGLFGSLEGTVKNLSVEGEIKTSSGSAGGIAGYNGNAGIIENCIFIGSTCGSIYSCGIAGSNYSNGLISNCCVKMQANATINQYPISSPDGGGRFKNCYYNDELNDDGISRTTSVSSYAFSSGELCWLLNNSIGKTIWYQDIDCGTENDYPIPSPRFHEVYKTTYCTSEDTYYSNYNMIHHNFLSDKCSECGLSGITTESASIILNDSIDMKYYLTVNNPDYLDNNIALCYSYDNDNTDLSVLCKNEYNNIFSAVIPCKTDKMNSNIYTQAKVFENNQIIYKDNFSTEYSILKYADNILEDTDGIYSNDCKVLILNILRYGSEIQKYFSNDNTMENIINDEYIRFFEQYDVTCADADNPDLSYLFQSADSPYTSIDSVYLTVDSKITINIKVKAESTGYFLQFTDTITGESRTIPLVQTSESGKYLAKIKDVSAESLLHDFTLAVIDENNNVLSHTLGYNIEKYIYAVENSSNEQINKASDVCLALLGYARSVKNYCENLNS